MTKKKVTPKTRTDENEDEVLKAMGLNTELSIVKRKRLSKQEVATLQSNAFQVDDEFSTLHDSDRRQIIPPPFNPRFLVSLCAHNNALMQNVAAMEVNIDGTGHEITSIEEVEPVEDGEKQPEEAKSEAAEDFFDEPWPFKSFITIRREKRRHEETTGNAYFEIVRNPTGEIVLLDVVDATTIRMVRLDEPVVKTVRLKRKGKEQDIKILHRDRRFMQRSGLKPDAAGGPAPEKGKGMIFFKAYGTTRDLDKFTGKWADEGKVIAAEARASELLHFTINKMPGTPYGIPRWINQIPSVLGSRKAEELNLDFFNSGGLPPAMIIVQGGILTEVVRQQIQTYLSGKGGGKNRAMVLEVHAASGDMDKAGNVKVTVERFGADRQKDSLWEKYDERSEQRVRSSFRLPPLFVGKSEDMNFATAKTSYMIAEAQVFKPERDEFDEIMNKTVMKEIAPDFEFRSMPITLRDVENQLKAVELAVKNLNVDDEEAIGALNEVVDLDLKVSEDEPEPEPMPPLPPGVPSGEPPVAGTPAAPAAPVSRAIKMGYEELIRLAQEWAGITLGTIKVSRQGRKDLIRIVDNLPEGYKQMFHHLAAINMMAGYGHDPKGVDSIAKVAARICNEHDHGDDVSATD